MLGADAKVYPFGSAPGLGDASGHISGSAVGIAPTPDNKGYWTVTTTGQVFQFGTAPALGSVAAGVLIPGELVTGLAATPSGKGYIVFTTRGRAVPFLFLLSGSASASRAASRHARCISPRMPPVRVTARIGAVER